MREHKSDNVVMDYTRCLEQALERRKKDPSATPLYLHTSVKEPRDILNTVLVVYGLILRDSLVKLPGVGNEARNWTVPALQPRNENAKQPSRTTRFFFR